MLWVRLVWVYASRGFGYLRGEPINFSPQSGEGPPAWLVREGGFTMEVTATAPSGRQAVCVVRGTGDPGYGATAKMLGEVGLGLSFDVERAAGSGGVLTPWTGMGDVLVTRLRQAEGSTFMSFDVRA